MGAAVHVLELLDAHLGINGGGFEFFVAEELLDETNDKERQQRLARVVLAQPWKILAREFPEAYREEVTDRLPAESPARQH